MRSMFLVLSPLFMSVVDTSVCPDAGTAAGPCFEGECNDGYTCSDNGFCCPEVERFDVQADSSSNRRSTTRSTPTTRRITTRRVYCVDGALNCGMFIPYCRPGTMYTYCMWQHCRHTCRLC